MPQSGCETLSLPGIVDERSIVDVDPDDLAGYGQCHFFAGIGGWPYALRLAGWPDDLPVWTGSCPCQPLSCAGRRKGHADERHLWPAFYRLIAERRPAIIFGEQVAGALGREWLAGVRADLEDAGYAVGAADLCAAGKGAPHIRQRLYWMGHAERSGLEERAGVGRDDAAQRAPTERTGGVIRGLAVTYGSVTWDGHLQPGGEHGQQPQDCGVGGLADTDESVGGQGSAFVPRRDYRGDAKQGTGPCGGGGYFWSDAEWLPCTDGRARRIEPGTSPLAHRVPARVGRLRGYGNAIVPPLAAEFIAAVMELRP